MHRVDEGSETTNLINQYGSIEEQTDRKSEIVISSCSGSINSQMFQCFKIASFLRRVYVFTHFIQFKFYEYLLEIIVIAIITNKVIV